MEKRCYHCQKTKALSEFGSNKSLKDGLNVWCKECVRENNSKRLEYKKAWARAYAKTPEGKARRAEYRRQPEQVDYRRKHQRLQASRHPERHSARRAVIYAVKTGKLPKATTLLCVHCDQPAVEYHHALGYSKEHRLAVEPVCKECHTCFWYGRD